MEKLEVRVKDNVMRPLNVVFNAITQLESLSGFFISRSAGPLVEGQTVDWFFDDAKVRVAVHILNLDPAGKLSFEWGASGSRARVDMVLTSLGENETGITITEKSFDFDRAGVERLMQQTQGWTDFICSLKAFLYCGINLRIGRTPDSYR